MNSGPQPDQFENLVAILTLAAILALAGSAIHIAGQYASDPSTAFRASRNVVGYVRPRPTSPRQDQDMVHDAFKNPKVPPTGDLTVKMSPADAQLLKQRFDQSVALLHAKKYDYAIIALNQVIELQPKLPDAYVNIGFAYLGLEQWDTALRAFTKASDLKPDQANAYYGMAMAWEGKEDYASALGAMRSFIHMTTPEDPFLPKARSALWEWEELLGRVKGPHNPKKPAGSTEEGPPPTSPE